MTAPKAPPAKAVPWRTGERQKTTVKPAAKPVVAVPAKPTAKRRSVWETHVLPLVFLTIVVLVLGGYLAGWHLS